MIYFDMLFMKLSQFYDLSHNFNKLIRVESLFLLIFFQFHLSILSWLQIELHNLFLFPFLRLSRSHDLYCIFGSLILIDLNFLLVFFCFLNWYFSNFIIQSWSHDSDSVFGELTLVDSNCFFLRKNWYFCKIPSIFCWLGVGLYCFFFIGLS